MKNIIVKVKAITLVEMLVAVSLFSIVFISVSSLDLFVRRNYSDTDRKAKLHNEISPTIEHIVKTVSQGIGDATLTSRNPANITTNASGDPLYLFRIPTPGADADPISLANTTWCAYVYKRPGNTQTSYQVWYYPDYSNTTNYDILSNKITALNMSFVSSDISRIQFGLTARYDPSNNVVSSDNPEVVFSTSIQMRAVSTS